MNWTSLFHIVVAVQCPVNAYWVLCVWETAWICTSCLCKKWWIYLQVAVLERVLQLHNIPFKCCHVFSWEFNDMTICWLQKKSGENLSVCHNESWLQLLSSAASHPALNKSNNDRRDDVTLYGFALPKLELNRTFWSLSVLFRYHSCLILVLLIR